MRDRQGKMMLYEGWLGSWVRDGLGLASHVEWKGVRDMWNCLQDKELVLCEAVNKRSQSYLREANKRRHESYKERSLWRGRRHVKFSTKGLVVMPAVLHLDILNAAFPVSELFIFQYLML